MDKLVVASMRKSAGKTSLIAGIARALQKSCGYIKPFGDRLLYRKKRLWDYDAALITNILKLEQHPEDISLGFEHAKLRYMYGVQDTNQRLLEIAEKAAQDKSILFIESGADLGYGSSVHLDALSIARTLGAKLLIVAAGEPDSMIDDLTFLKRSIDLTGIDFRGVILNKIRDPQDFSIAYQSRISDLGLTVLGMVPQRIELSYLSVGYLADRLFGKIVTGHGLMERQVEHVFIGSMSANAALQHPQFRKAGKLVITSGDRADMIVAALESETSAVLVTDNQLPSSNLIAKATERNVPVIAVPGDAYQTAKQIDDMEPLITKEETRKHDLLEQLVKETIQLDKI
jgi:uncharacterized protein